MEELTIKELKEYYKKWLDTQKIKVYCSDYPIFISEVFPEGIRIIEEEGE